MFLEEGETLFFNKILVDKGGMEGANDLPEAKIDVEVGDSVGKVVLFIS